MTEPVTRLRAALADRYRIERELGQGGMATVYLAEDLKHHRQVAVKVLRPELAATLGPERFVREIEVAARLQHPHILGVLDSGNAGGFFYYVMPFVAGETLRDRLARGGELPVYERQGRVDRALRAVRRRWMPMGEPEPAGLAESFRLEGRLAALADDKVGAIRAYRNYLKLRIDPEPSRRAQLDSVRAELSAVGDLEGER